MAATTAPTLTVEQFRQLPETGPFYYELRGGELIAVTRPKFRHFRLQKRLEQRLEAVAGTTGVVAMEFAFRALPEYELRVADVAYVTAERWEAIDLDDNLHGAPEIVIEILSPSNTASEMYEKEQLCLEHGSLEFWVVDPEHRLVKVSTPNGLTATYRSGQGIPLSLFGGATLSIDELFA